MDFKGSLVQIVAVSNNGFIGKNNAIPWRIPTDLQHFKCTTENQTVVMGRRTYESIGKKLPNRRVIVLAATGGKDIKDVEVVFTEDQLFDLIKDEELVYVAGGGEVYRMLFPYTTAAIVTHVNTTIWGSVTYPLDYLYKRFDRASLINIPKQENDDYEIFIGFYVRKPQAEFGVVDAEDISLYPYKARRYFSGTDEWSNWQICSPEKSREYLMRPDYEFETKLR